MTGIATDSTGFTGVTRADERLDQAVRDNYQFIWRSLRRLGLGSDDAVDDATQRVFEIAAKKLPSIEPGRERAFFFKTGLKVAHELRRRGRLESSRFGGDS